MGTSRNGNITFSERKSHNWLDAEFEGKAENQNGVQGVAGSNPAVPT